MSRTFQELLAEKLAGFGIPVLAADIPDQATVLATFNRIGDWELSVDDLTWKVINMVDITDGMWNVGFMNDWPGLYTMLKAAPLGTWRHTFSDIGACIDRAADEAAHGEHDVEPDLVPTTGIDDIVEGAHTEG